MCIACSSASRGTPSSVARSSVNRHPHVMCCCCSGGICRLVCAFVAKCTLARHHLCEFAASASLCFSLSVTARKARVGVSRCHPVVDCPQLNLVVFLTTRLKLLALESPAVSARDDGLSLCSYIFLKMIVWSGIVSVLLMSNFAKPTISVDIVLPSPCLV